MEEPFTLKMGPRYVELPLVIKSDVQGLHITGGVVKYLGHLSSPPDTTLTHPGTCVKGWRRNLVFGETGSVVWGLVNRRLRRRESRRPASSTFFSQGRITAINGGSRCGRKEKTFYPVSGVNRNTGSPGPYETPADRGFQEAL